ncbi:MAG TPA: serine--tRNA ligase, partial [Verrucomicrobiales bacterium]|nr:serine--tRNA ligase [Verrucomicrobiales bacterium]
EQVDEVLALDEARRRGETEKQALQGERNRLAKEIGGRRAKGENTEDQEQEARAVGERIAVLANDVDGMEERQRALLLALPNLPHDQCPEGSGALENPVVRSWGEPRTSGSELRDHMEIAGRLALLDFEAAATLSGSGFVVFRGAGARLERALIQFLLDLQTIEHGYTEISPPFVVRRECMTGTGQLPKFEDDMYGLEDGDLFLAPTAEVPVTNLHRESILGFGELPVRYAAYTPCFRREAGSAGRESRGLIRMHQFDKVELVQIAHPAASFAVLEELTGHAEAALQRLGLHYRVIELCAGDLGFSAAKTYDIEVWAPGQKAWLEVSSCSNFGDYQARRMGLRFKDENGKNRFCHTLNGSGTALPRLYVALLETWQDPDGSVSIPEALRPYFGADRIGPQPAG